MQKADLLGTSETPSAITPIDRTNQTLDNSQRSIIKGISTKNTNLSKDFDAGKYQKIKKDKKPPQVIEQDEDDGEMVDESSDEERSRITNINSLDPKQWSRLKRDVQDDHQHKSRDAVQKNLIF